MTTKYTSGPWEAYFVASAGWSVRKQHEREGYRGLAPVCSMAWWQFDIPGVIDDEISGANARLIAAAPELLEACEAAHAVLTEPGVMDVDEWKQMSRAAVNKLSAVLAKATVPIAMCPICGGIEHGTNEFGLYCVKCCEKEKDVPKP